MKKFILSIGALAILLAAVPAQAAVLNIREYNRRVTAIHGVTYPVRWNNGKILSVYLYRYTLGSTVLQRELDANVCGGWHVCDQLRQIGDANECKNFGKICRGR